MTEMTAEKQIVWDKLKGITHPVVKKYFENKPGKRKQYERIQRYLNKMPVSFKPVRAKREGPGFEIEYWYNGLNKIAETHPRRVNTIPNAIREIEEDVGQFGYDVAWDKMTCVYRPVYTRYMADIVLGIDVFVEGIATRGEEQLRICYFYDNSKYEEGAGRWLILGTKKVRIGDSNKVLKDED